MDQSINVNITKIFKSPCSPFQIIIVQGLVQPELKLFRISIKTGKYNFTNHLPDKTQ